ncbi:MAG TPA: DUF4097 family beta strand repeat-containing protein [Kofleriaceae bacterium]|nr:DUF4097 family beta strand repeat-containing protein [Kofleriaceae bacterium]
MRAPGPAIASLSSFLLATALSLTVLADPAASTAIVQRDAVEVSPAKGIRIDLVDIDNRLGDVRIEGHDRETISIVAVKRAPDQETMERLKVSLVPDPSGPVTITTSLRAGQEARPIPAGSVRIDLVVLAPRRARVRAQVWKGHVEVKGVDNGADLTTDDGDIDVTAVSGAVTTQSGHGRHTFAQIFGAVEARSVEGDMSLDLVRGERLDAMVNHGDVIARRIRVRDLSVRIMRGNVRLDGEAMPGGHYAVASYWGNVEVRFSGRAPLRVLARARSGQVSLPQRFRRRRGEGGLVTGYAGGGRLPAELDLRTRVGMITVADF